MQDTSGRFSDGTGNYPANLVCQFRIISSAPIVLTFDSLSVEQNYDFVRVYDGMSDQSPMLAALTGSVAQPITSSGSLFIVFTSDGSVQSSGFVASYAPLTRRRPAVLHTEQDQGDAPVWQRTPIVAAAAVAFIVIAMAVFLVVRSYQSKNVKSISSHNIPLPMKTSKHAKRSDLMARAEVTSSEVTLEQDPYNVPGRKGGSVLWT